MQEAIVKGAPHAEQKNNDHKQARVTRKSSYETCDNSGKISKQNTTSFQE